MKPLSFVDESLVTTLVEATGMNPTAARLVLLKSPYAESLARIGYVQVRAMVAVCVAGMLLGGLNGASWANLGFFYSAVVITWFVFAPLAYFRARTDSVVTDAFGAGWVSPLWAALAPTVYLSRRNAVLMAEAQRVGWYGPGGPKG